MRTVAAVMRKFSSPLELEEVELDPPQEGEVLLSMVAAGICGSDRHILEGRMGSPLPSVAGHEGAGIVEAVGPGVSAIAVGDHVIQTFVGPCGHCDRCVRGQRSFCRTGMPPGGTMRDGTFRMHALDGSPIAMILRLGTFSAHTVTPQENCVVIPPELDLVPSALVSCGFSTGAGAAVNVAGVGVGDAVAVMGVGGVGCAAIVGATLAGAAELVAIDVRDQRAEDARFFGATHFVDASTTDVLSGVLAATNGRGVDKMLLTMDHIAPEHLRLAVDCLAPCGVVVQVGVVDPPTDTIPVPPMTLLSKQAAITGTVYGGSDPARDALRWLGLYRAGRIPLERFVTRTYDHEHINDAFADLAAGRNVRGVIRYR